ncbi:MAG: glycosyltransferase family 39 protein [Chloroflexota bacterium]
MIQNQNNLIKWGLITVFILWFFFIVASYFVVYKPFSPLLLVQLSEFVLLPAGFSLGAVADLLFNLAFGVWFLFVALGVGTVIWGFVGKTAVSPKTTPLEHALFSIGAGVGAIGLLVLLMGGLRLLNTLALSILAIGLTLVTLTAVKQMPKLSLRQARGTLARPALLYITVALFFVLTLALLPPTNWDGLFYHLKGPKLYLDAGRIYGGVNIPHLSFPSLFQMNFLLGMALRGDIAAQLIHFTFIPLLAGLVYSMTVQILGGSEGGTAVLFLLATPMVLTLGAWTYNDLALAFYSVGALYAFLRWQQSEARFWLIWAGLFAGFAMSMKYTSFMTPLFIGLMLLWQARRDWRKQLPNVVLYGVVAWLVALPWFIKNGILTGNPFYPFLFDGQFWDEFRSMAYSEPGTGIGFDIIALLKLPYDMTLALQDASRDGLAGAFFLGFLPLILFYIFAKVGKRPLKPMRPIMLFVLAHYLVWMAGVINSQALWQVRLFLPGLVALIPPMAWVYEAIREWDHPQFSLRNFMNLALGFVLSMLLLTQFWGWLSVQPWAYLTGTETRDQFLTRNLGTHHAAMVELNEMLPETAVVQFLWEPRSYYCDHDCRPDSILDEFPHLVYLHENAENIHQAWLEDDVTHVLIWQDGYEFILEEDRLNAQQQDVILQTLIQNHLSPMSSEVDLGYEFYTVNN